MHAMFLARACVCSVRAQMRDFTCFSQVEAILPVHIVLMELDLYHFPDDLDYVLASTSKPSPLDYIKCSLPNKLASCLVKKASGLCPSSIKN
jgi:hypothetical protein